MTTNQNKVGCVDQFNYGNAHQLQLWLNKSSIGFEWILRNAFVPGGRLTRSCVLESGVNLDYDDALRFGQAAFDRVKAEEQAKVAPAEATAGGANSASV